jgi:hypothetical protein
MHKQHSWYQQGGILTTAFTCLSGFVKSTGTDHTGLGCWPWIQVGSGKHPTRIVTAYQPYWGSNTPRLGPISCILHRGMVASQHQRYFRKKRIFTNLWKAFTTQLDTQLCTWRAAGEKIILFANMDTSVYTGRLAGRLWSNGLLMEEQKLWSPSREAPHTATKQDRW